jgi:hypothetical protein
MYIAKCSMKTRSFAFLCSLCVLCGSVVSFSSLQAASPREELLGLVPDSVGFCFVVQDLRGQAAALQNSPFVEQLSRTPVAQKIRTSDDLKKLDYLESKIKEKLGLDWTQLRDDILGDALVLAYRPGPPGKPDQEQGVLLLRARNAKALADLIERVNKLQKEEGELKEVQERRHKDVVYYRRLEYDKRSASDKPPSYFYVHGPILALSSQESILREIIERDRGASSSLPEAARRLRELDAERATLAMWINPRAFDAEVDAKTGNTSVERTTAAKHFARYWKALDSVVLSLSLEERQINLALGVRARIEELPPAAQRLFSEGAKPSEVWKRFPESALLAAGGRIDGATLLEVIGGFLTKESRQTLHATLNRQLAALLGEEDFARDVLPALGPDWGLCVTAPSVREKNWMPQSLFALRVAADRTKKSVDRKLLGALDFAARLILFAHNSQNPDAPLVLKNGEVDGQEIRYLASERGLPPGVQPAYGLLHGYLVLSSSVDGLTRFTQAQLPSSTSPSPGEKVRDAGTTVAPVPLLRISIKDWRTYLHERRESIALFLADQHKLSRDLAERQLDGLLTALQFVERIELHQRFTTGQVLFTLSVQTAHALKK